MGAKLSGGRGKGGKTIEANADINVTPFVDVMLVLLIIFMVSAPLATVSIRLDLPPPQPPIEGQEPEPPTFISIQENGDLFIATGEDAPAATELTRLDADLFARLGNREERVMIRADADVLYNSFMEVMNELQDKGWFQIGLINEDIE